MQPSDANSHDIIVHVGLPKSGSSAIQKFCLEQRSTFEKNGIYYPKHDIDRNGVSGGHSKLLKLIDSGQLEEAKSLVQRYLKKAQKKHCTLLLSNEGLHRFSAELKTLLDGYNAKVIAFYRHPYDSLFSSYNQVIKRHYHSDSVHDYIRHAITFERPVIMGSTLNQCAENLQNRLSVKAYHPELSGSNSAIAQFLTELNLANPDDFAVPHKRINSSYCLAALEIKRLLNYVVTKDMRDLNRELDTELQAVSESEQYLKTHLQNVLTPSQVEALHAKFADRIDEIERKFSIKLPSPEQPNFKEYSSFRALNEQVSIIAHIREKCRSAYKKIQSLLRDESFEVTNADQLRLLELFDIPPTENQSNYAAFFSSKTIENMVEYSEVDFLRETVKVLITRGDLEHAGLLIDKALKLRPRGPALLRLKQQIIDES